MYKVACYTLMFVLLTAVLVCGAGCRSIIFGKDDFRMEGGQLYRGDKAFTVYGIETPGLGATSGAPGEVVPAMARVAEAGGNAICFDLRGFNEDGSELDPTGVQTVDAIAFRAKDSRMGVLVRVLGDSSDPAFRNRAVRTAAKAFRGHGMAIYLIDGPDAAELAETFKKAAPQLIVAAPQNGDLSLTGSPPQAPPEMPTLLAGAIPDFSLGAVHFLLEGNDSDYAALDAALMTEAEKSPWTPDNTVLSEAERQEGFVALFDGKTLNGWWYKGENKESFQVSEDGFIEWRAGGGEALMSRERYGDFILRLQWKILPGGNSGVWCRAPRGARASKFGFEVQMRGDFGAEELTKDNTGAVYDVVPPLSLPTKQDGLWNDLEVVCQGPHVKVTINGQVVQDLSFDGHEELAPRLRRGFIGLTDHDNYVAFRNIRIKPL
ncbi:MAG: DUF1080 domain-containing protein [Candidatus Hydrogenedentes bacterium]|nr:DUF1080 domain-containing protein [Candidatus Hydrogenedentota bacterium]